MATTVRPEQQSAPSPSAPPQQAAPGAAPPGGATGAAPLSPAPKPRNKLMIAIVVVATTATQLTRISLFVEPGVFTRFDVPPVLPA